MPLLLQRGYARYVPVDRILHVEQDRRGEHASVGLDAAKARDVLNGNDYAEAVRAEEQQFQAMGIQSVPSIVFNQKYLVTGGQPVEAFEQVIQQILAEENAGA